MALDKFADELALLLLLCFVGLSCFFKISQAQNSPNDYLSPHNAARAKVGVEPLTWDNRVADYAQNYANQRGGDCDLIHSNGPYGENIAWWSPGNTFSAANAVKLWVDEKPYYDYNSNSCAPGADCLHYTQVVWRESVRLGCGKVECNNGRAFITCNYDPAGNYIGERPY